MKRGINARLQGLVDDVLDRLRTEQDIASAFDLAGWMATALWKNHSSIYRLDELETILLEKLSPLPDPPVAPPDATYPEVHLATHVFRSGGHTSLMGHLIEQASGPVSVLLTRMTNVEVAAQALGVPIEHVHSAGHLAHPENRVHALARELLKSARVVVAIHPNDVLGAVALRMAKDVRADLPLGFMNHADHVFSTGIGACDHVFEISVYGWGLRDARGTTAQSSFVGIPIRPRAADPDANSPPDQPPVFLTGGSPYKFRPLQGLSLPPALTALMKRHPRAQLTILGPTPRDWWWWPLRATCRHRVELRKAIPRERYQELLRRCSVYIDSYPIPGGTALPEALMAGRHIAGIRGVVWGYSCADELLDTSPEGFLNTCARLLEGDRPTLEQQQAVRARCAQWHAPDEVRRRLDASWSGKRTPPPMGGFQSAMDERLLERLWHLAGKLAHPGRRECPLSRANKRWLARKHLSHFGWRSWSTLKLLFYAYVRA